jgi:thiamine-monophosphate kinase
VPRLLRDLGEHAWIARLTGRLAARSTDRRVIVGPGDDAAVIRTGRRPLVLTTDALVEDVHFRRAWLTPSALGRRAFAVNASDVAAMGARPTAALLAIETAPRFRTADLDAIVGGFAAAARRAGATLVGGNLTSGPHLAITVALLGEADGRVVTRAGARPGDAVYVTGSLGRTGAAVRRLRSGGRGRLPPLPDRVRAGRLLAGVAGAMIDVSDGLVQDLGHVCRASGVAAELVLADLPVSAVCRSAIGADAASFAAGAGEDYELLVTIPRRREAALARLTLRLGCAITRIGRIVRGRPSVRIDGAATKAEARAGFDHFRGRRSRV